MKKETQIIHEGNPTESTNAIMPSITLSTTFERGEDGLSHPSGYIYSRYDTPNRHSLETKLCLLENGASAVAFASGLTAAMAIFQGLDPNAHVILPDDTYFGVRSILNKLYGAWGLTHTLVDMTDLASVRKAIKKNTKIIWLETPSNPSLKITDIAAIVKIAQAKGITTVCDNTWATPYFTKVLDMGVDVSLHSTTKYLGGHSDILGGVLIFKENTPLAEFARTYQGVGGAVPSPFDCWLLCRSLATFHARMPIHASNAMQLALFLEKQTYVEKILYPGLKSAQGHRIAAKQMKGGFGGMLSILVRGGQNEALTLAQRLKIFRHATSLGGIESLIEHRRSIEGATSPTPENLLRISVGIEHIDDLIADFEQAASIFLK